MNNISNVPEVHEWTGPTGIRFRDVREPSGTYYRDTVPREVINTLEDVRISGERIRLFLGDAKTGKCWHDENQLTGTVSRSSGPIHIPILLANNRSNGGPAILCDCIIKIISKRGTLYQHPKFDNGLFTMEPISTFDLLYTKGYTHRVLVDGKEIANFKSDKKAMRWMDFMTGKRLNK